MDPLEQCFFFFYVSVDYYKNSSLITFKMNGGDPADLTVKHFVRQNKMYNDRCATPTLFVAVMSPLQQVVVSLGKPVFQISGASVF